MSAFDANLTSCSTIHDKEWLYTGSFGIKFANSNVGLKMSIDNADVLFYPDVATFAIRMFKAFTSKELQSWRLYTYKDGLMINISNNKLIYKIKTDQKELIEFVGTMDKLMHNFSAFI